MDLARDVGPVCVVRGRGVPWSNEQGEGEADVEVEPLEGTGTVEMVEDMAEYE